jgi:hypothetical protein
MQEVIEAVMSAVSSDSAISGALTGGFHLHQVPADKRTMPFAYIESVSSAEPQYTTSKRYIEDVTIDIAVKGKPKTALQIGRLIRAKLEDQPLTLSSGRMMRGSVSGVDFNDEGDDDESGEQVSSYEISLVFKQQQASA